MRRRRGRERMDVEAGESAREPLLVVLAADGGLIAQEHAAEDDDAENDVEIRLADPAGVSAHTRI